MLWIQTGLIARCSKGAWPAITYIFFKRHSAQIQFLPRPFFSSIN
jgi:hypothetical protein